MAISFILSTTFALLLSFIIKAFTSSSFDKLFIQKHQKALQNFVIVFVGFGVAVAYCFFLMSFYMSFKDVKCVNLIMGISVFIYIIGIFWVSILCIIKWIKDKKIEEDEYRFSAKHTNRVTLLVIVLNMIVYSRIFFNVVFKKEPDQIQHISNIVVSIVIFVFIMYMMILAQSYLTGHSKMKWRYVLSPKPKDIDQKHLFVLYSLSPTQLVLSEEENPKVQFPLSVYLYDIAKESCLHFERVPIVERRKTKREGAQKKARLR